MYNFVTILAVCRYGTPSVSFAAICPSSIEYGNIFTRSKFIQKPRVIVSECAHAHVVWRPLIYMWKRCEILSSDLKWTFVRWHILTMPSTMKTEPEKKFDAITGIILYLCSTMALCELPSLRSSCTAAVPCADALQYAMHYYRYSFPVLPILH